MSREDYMPRYLDAPMRIMIWTIDEFILSFIPFILLVLIADAPIAALCVAALLSFCLKKLKGSQTYHAIFRVMYWYLPALIRLKATPPSYMRLWLG